MVARSQVKTLVVALAVACVACDRAAGRSSERGRTIARVSCVSSEYSAAAIGYSLALTRSARKFATTQSQRLSLARLEPFLVALVQLEPDSAVRSGAWLRAADSGIAEGASYNLEELFSQARDIERQKGVLRSREYVTEAYDAYYHDRIAEVVRNLSPENVDACRQPIWQKAFAAALDAAARGAQ